MTAEATGTVTQLLAAARDGDSAAVGRVCELLYHDLRRLARSRLRTQQTLTLLDTTALVHESFMRLVATGQAAIPDRNRFLAYAARVMHSIIIDTVRAKHAERRGGKSAHVTLDTMLQGTLAAEEEELLRLSEAIEHLRDIDERAMRVVEMRYFAGMVESEIALALDITERTVRRDWQKAKLLLQAALEDAHG